MAGWARVDRVEDSFGLLTFGAELCSRGFLLPRAVLSTPARLLAAACMARRHQSPKTRADLFHPFLIGASGVLDSSRMEAV